MVTLALCAIGAGAGLFLGSRPPPSETQVIEHAAALFATETGSAPTECVGVPGDGQVWIEVRCGTGKDSQVYQFDRSARRITEAQEPST